MASIDGLSSGIATSDLINQLMRLERMPQVRLQTERSKVVRVNSLYNEVNRQMAAIAAAAKAVTGANGWDAAKATSSDTSRVAATASASAPAGSLTFAVERLAKAGSAVSAGTVASTDAVIATAGTKVYLNKGTDETEIDVGDGTLSTVVARINAADAGVTASAVNVGGGEYRLQLTSTTTGAASNVSVDDTAGAGGADPFTALGGLDPLVTGVDARLRVGGVGGTGGYTIERDSNTFSDVLDGVTFTLLNQDTAADVTVTVEGDTGALADRVSKLVDAANAALSGMAKQQAYDADSKSAGPLMGDSLVRRLRSDLVRSATDAVAGNDIASPGLAGIEVQRDGTLKFDRAVFIEQYEQDPAAVQGLLGRDTGVAGRLEQLAANAKTQIDATVKARTDTLPGIDNRIASWDRRLEIREQTLRRQFEGMEVALGRMQQQSQWLAGQLAGLPTYSGGN